MRRRKLSNQGAALSRVEWVLVCARRVAVHAQGGKPVPVMVPGAKLTDLRVALENAGVDMGKARNFSKGAIKAQKTIKANKGNHLGV